MRNVWRGLTWLGVFLVLGPGSSIPNDFDVLYAIAGIFLISIGVLGVVFSSRQRPMMEEDGDSNNEAD